MSNSDSSITEEVWKPVHRFIGYYSVSNMGRVRSEERVVRRTLANGEVIGMTVAEKILSTPPNADGYLVVSLHRNGCRSTVYVHDLVLRAFEGVKKPGQEVRHLDDDKSNATLANLAFGSRSDNAFDSVRNGTHVYARRTECSQGHAYTESNTTRHSNRPGTRVCRTCERDRKQRHLMAKRELVAA